MVKRANVHQFKKNVKRKNRNLAGMRKGRESSEAGEKKGHEIWGVKGLEKRYVPFFGGKMVTRKQAVLQCMGGMHTVEMRGNLG